MSKPVIAISNLEVAVADRVLVRDVNLQLHSGELAIIIGPNGAGKTSLLRALLGDVTPGRGEIELGGVALGKWSHTQRAKSVAALPQLSLLNFPFTAAEVIGLSRTPHSSGAAIDQEIIRAAAQSLDISHLMARVYTLLSGGEKQRVQLARVLAQIWRQQDVAPPPGAEAVRLLLLDEPNASQDIGHQQVLMRAVQTIAAQGVAVLMVEHDVGLAAHYADRLIAMNDSRIISQGSAQQVVTDDLMREVFYADIDVQLSDGRPVLVRRKNAL